MAWRNTAERHINTFYDIELALAARAYQHHVLLHIGVGGGKSLSNSIAASAWAYSRSSGSCSNTFRKALRK
jgi:hypothetical protein